MGTSSLLDIIGSMTTFGLLLLAVLRLNGAASENNYAYNQNYLIQRNMVVLTVLLEQDLNNVGAGAIDPYGGIQKADVDDLIFKADLNRDGVGEIIEWKLGPQVPGLQNTSIRYLSRIVGGVESKMNLGVTKFTFRYWNVADPTIPVQPLPIYPPPYPGYTGISTGNIGPVEVYIQLESPYKLKPEYTQKNDTLEYQMSWRQIRSISRNNSVQ